MGYGSLELCEDREVTMNIVHILRSQRIGTAFVGQEDLREVVAEMLSELLTLSLPKGYAVAYKHKEMCILR